ncbi:ABC transporter substrate-binding protein [Pseudonocardia acaciae]|uniref:ABC transporter substrate-binding protein n=1 Tax=Pseudonocardia acaciae TaxID=551276 RepID=UPI000490EA66|nr:ABC transporter substrate-binding protein [Pseudonocardia acaciae]
MTRGGRALLAASVAAALLVAAGCAGGGPGNGGAGTGQPRQGGTFTVGIPQFTICYDASQTPFVPYVHNAVVDTLLEQDPKTKQILPWLAERHEIENNGARYVLHLKKGVTFSNGEPFDAAAVKASFEDAVALGKLGKSPQASAYLTGYAGSDVLDPHTIAINFRTPKAGFEQALTERALGIIAPATIKTRTPEQRCAEGVVGTGPYVIDKIVPDQEVTLRARADYAWQSPNQRHPGRPYVDKLVFRRVPESAVRVGSVLSGQLDAITSIPALDLDQLTSAGNEILWTSAAGSVYSFFFNYTKPVTADPSVRAAFLHGINRQELVDTAYTSYDRPATGVLSPGVPQYLDQSAKLRYDPDASRRILDVAGWVPGPDGIRVKDDRRLSVRFKYSDEEDKTPAELFQQQLRKIGIEFLVEQVTRAQLTEWEAPNTGWDIIAAPLTRPDADILLSRYHPEFSWWLGGQNLDPYPEVTALLEQEAAQLDPARRAQLAATAQELIVDNAYAVPVRQVTTIWALARRAHGLWLTLPYPPSFTDVWVDGG